MEYIDSGSRNPAETLGHWFQETLNQGIRALRVQTGFYSLDGISPLLSALDSLRSEDRQAKILIGSNDGATLGTDVHELALRLGIPRSNAQLGIVCFNGSYFHPKVYHFERGDGTQTAYVGSANLTSSGLELHTEAGVTLDSRIDDVRHLNKIAAAIDEWFSAPTRLGMSIVPSIETIHQLVADGILSLRPLPRAQAPAITNASDRHSRPTQRRLLGLPSVARLTHQTLGEIAPAETVSNEEQRIPVARQVRIDAPYASTSSWRTPTEVRENVRDSENIEGFPRYFWFEPEPTSATTSVEALSGITLPEGTSGLIIRLNRDSTRHFHARPGTANISLPVETVQTLRFGLSGRHGQPTAHLQLDMRYLSDTSILPCRSSMTSVRGYGYTSEERGHGDVRLVVTAAAADLKPQILHSGGELPKDGDLALLEWPTNVTPRFRLSFLDSGGSLHATARSIYRAAEDELDLVGTSSCWLPPGLAVPW